MYVGAPLRAILLLHLSYRLVESRVDTVWTNRVKKAQFNLLRLKVNSGIPEEKVARPEGFEPPTFGFEVHRSIH
jgi:hypothetical protein